MLIHIDIAKTRIPVQAASAKRNSGQVKSPSWSSVAIYFSRLRVRLAANTVLSYLNTVPKCSTMARSALTCFACLWLPTACALRGINQSSLARVGSAPGPSRSWRAATTYLRMVNRLRARLRSRAHRSANKPQVRLGIPGTETAIGATVSEVA